MVNIEIHILKFHLYILMKLKSKIKFRSYFWGHVGKKSITKNHSLKNMFLRTIPLILYFKYSIQMICNTCGEIIWRNIWKEYTGWGKTWNEEKRINSHISQVFLSEFNSFMKSRFHFEYLNNFLEILIFHISFFETNNSIIKFGEFVMEILNIDSNINQTCSTIKTGKW